MLNLIRRDIILQKRQMIIFIPFILFFVLTGVPPILTFFVASFFIPFNAYAYDEKTDANILLNSLPYTRKQIVAARYVGALVFMFVASVLVALSMMIFNRSFSLTDAAIGALAFLLFGAIAFPLFYILKQGYITLVLMFVVIVGGIMSQPVIRFLSNHLTAITTFFIETPDTSLYSGAAIIILLIYAASWTFTTIIYQKKAF
ncbi:ABC-2 transporter permease [Jeotgalibacillus malaysiensis]|uniref:ABC-2 transporter permease n=1 Tax=Jeotgalibacillus malaysiensis TaxID=1508404 RepID=UPI00384B9C4E